MGAGTAGVYQRVRAWSAGGRASDALRQQEQDDRPGDAAGRDDRRDPAADPEHERLPVTGIDRRRARSPGS